MFIVKYITMKLSVMNISLHTPMVFGLIAAMAALFQSLAGYGDVSGGLPSWKERQILVLANACRMSPRQYRDAFVGNYAILDSLKYPAVPPLYASNQLNASARAHALDMGDTCGIMQHNSCNQTQWDVRIKSYYKASSRIGENIAVGNADPFATMKQWIMDSPPGTTIPAADSSLCTASAGAVSLCDGHRRNIMNMQYKELGAGYAYGTNSAVRNHHFWVQDFGGGHYAVSNPIVAGAHFLRETGKTTFLANYWDPTSLLPVEASVYIGGQKNAMTPLMGSSFRGTYQCVVARAANCRSFHYSFIDGAGKAWRYPEQGSLMTAGEGNCVDEYELPTGTVTNPNVFVVENGIQSKADRSSVIITAKNELLVPQTTLIVDGKGRTIAARRWDNPYRFHAAGKNVVLPMFFQSRLREGIYFLIHRISDSRIVCEKIVVIS